MQPGSPEEWRAVIRTFMVDHVRRAEAEGVVVGVSGGLDSAVVAALAAEAFGPERVTAVLMPSDDSDPQDEAHGRLLCDALGIQPLLRPIQPALEALPLPDPATRGNAKARLRMTILYAEAQASRRLVVGTGNKSEMLVGYFTKHGDGGNDMQPIGDLYKMQVRKLAASLPVPRPIIDKPPSAGLRPGQTDEDDLGMPYERLDQVLKGIEMNASPDAIAQRTGLDVAEVRRVAGMVRASEHKRHAPLIPKIGARTVGIDWRRSVHWDA